MLVDLVDDRLNALALTIVASTEHTAQQPCQRHLLIFLRRYSPPQRYSPRASMNRSTLSGTNPLIDFPARTRWRISVDETSMRLVEIVTTLFAEAAARDLLGPDLCITARVASSRMRLGFFHCPKLPSAS